MLEWLKERATEGNTLRAVAVVVAVLGATRILPADMIGDAAESITKAGLLLVAFDAFVTRQARK